MRFLNIIFFLLILNSSYSLEFVEINTPDKNKIKIALPKNFCLAPEENEKIVKKQITGLLESANLPQTVEVILNDCEFKSKYPWGYITVEKQIFPDDVTQGDLNAYYAPQWKKGLPET